MNEVQELNNDFLVVTVVKHVQINFLVVYHNEDQLVEVKEIEVAKVRDVFEQLFLLENDTVHVFLVGLDLVVVWQVVVLQKVLHVHV